MKAIVLSFDRQSGFAELVYKAYQHFWPGCPLEFLIPVNDRATNLSLPYLEGQANVTLVDAPADIRGTMASLLRGIPSEEWVFWCIDDRYPVALDAPRVSALYEAILRGDAEHALALKLMAWREPLSDERRAVAGVDFAVQQPVGLFGFWHHYFCRAAILKFFFGSTALAPDYRISDLTGIFHTGQPLPALSHTLVPTSNLIGLGEPCVEGELTTNGLEALRAFDCAIPPYRSAEMAKSFLHKDVAAEAYVSEASRDRHTYPSP